MAKTSSILSNIIKKLFLFRKVHLTNYIRIGYAQFGEDRVLRELLGQYIKTPGFYVDVGCYHPKKFSNTFSLYKQRWSGINIDLDQSKIDAFNMARKRDCNIRAAISNESKKVNIYRSAGTSLISTIDAHTAESNKEYQLGEVIKTQTLNDVIESTPYENRQIDLLTIDAEGHDFQVLQSLNIKKYKPKIIIIESHERDFNRILQSDIYIYLTNRGYQLTSWTFLSLFFVSPEVKDILR